jgi:hypothetical protein
MPTCENRKAATHALPRGPNPVEDRRMTLELPCDQDASYTATLKGVGTGKQRTGGTTQAFALCDNHSGLMEQIDKELIEEGWASALMGKRPTPL